MCPNVSDFTPESMEPEYHAPLVKCPNCGGDCDLEGVEYPGNDNPFLIFEFVCDPINVLDLDNEMPDCATWFKVKTDLNFQPVGLVEVGQFKYGCQIHYKVPWEKVRKTRQSGRFKP